MANGIRTGDPRGFIKGRSSKFRVGSRVRQTPEEGRGNIGRNVADITIKIKTIVRKLLTITIYIYIYIYIYIIKLKENYQYCDFIINLFWVYKMTPFRSREEYTVVYLNIILAGLQSFQQEENLKFLKIFSIFELKRTSLTVEISLYIIKYNVYTFFLFK